jgi:RNA polymerase sigma factor (sigma-70 family)
VSSNTAEILLSGGERPVAFLEDGAVLMKESLSAAESYTPPSDILPWFLLSSMSALASELDTRITRAYETHWPLLRSVAARKFRVPDDDIQELVQDVFVSFVRHHARIRDERSWLVAAICNASRDYWIRKGAASSALEWTFDPLVTSDADVDRLDVAAVLAQLSGRCAEVLRLRFFDGWSTDEVAIRLGITPNNVKQIVHRCKANARALFVERRRSV